MVGPYDSIRRFFTDEDELPPPVSHEHALDVRQEIIDRNLPQAMKRHVPPPLDFEKAQRQRRTPAAAPAGDPLDTTGIPTDTQWPKGFGRDGFGSAPVARLAPEPPDETAIADPETAFAETDLPPAPVPDVGPQASLEPGGRLSAPDADVSLDTAPESPLPDAPLPPEEDDAFAALPPDDAPMFAASDLPPAPRIPVRSQPAEDGSGDEAPPADAPAPRQMPSVDRRPDTDEGILRFIAKQGAARTGRAPDYSAVNAHREDRKAAAGDARQGAGDARTAERDALERQDILSRIAARGQEKKAPQRDYLAEIAAKAEAKGAQDRLTNAAKPRSELGLTPAQEATNTRHTDNAVEASRSRLATQMAKQAEAYSAYQRFAKDYPDLMSGKNATGALGPIQKILSKWETTRALLPDEQQKLFAMQKNFRDIVEKARTGAASNGGETKTYDAILGMDIGSSAEAFRGAIGRFAESFQTELRTYERGARGEALTRYLPTDDPDSVPHSNAGVFRIYAAQPPAGGPSAGGVIRMRAPDGTIEEVPPESVESALADKYERI